MADLLSHVLVGVVLAGQRMPAEERGWFLAGAIVPDLVSRAPGLALERLSAHIPMPEAMTGDWQIGLSFLHNPLGFALLAAWGVLLLPRTPLRAPRVRAWRALALGGLLHAAVDLLQGHLAGPPRMAFPFTVQGWELGWIGTEDSIYAWPILIPLALWTENRRRAAHPGPPAVGV